MDISYICEGAYNNFSKGSRNPNLTLINCNSLSSVFYLFLQVGYLNKKLKIDQIMKTAHFLFLIWFQWFSLFAWSDLRSCKDLSHLTATPVHGVHMEDSTDHDTNNWVASHPCSTAVLSAYIHCCVFCIPHIHLYIDSQMFLHMCSDNCQAACSIILCINTVHILGHKKC